MDVLENHGIQVRRSDIIQRREDMEQKNFLLSNHDAWEGDIITNPPYKYALEFIQKALELVRPGNKVAMFLKLTFLEGKARKKFFLSNPPKVVYVSSSRLKCAMNGDFLKYNESGTAIAYAWFVWEKGYAGDTVIKWFN